MRYYSFQHNMERQYKIMWKDDFATFLKDSPYFLPDKSATNDRLSVGIFT